MQVFAFLFLFCSTSVHAEGTLTPVTNMNGPGGLTDIDLHGTEATDLAWEAAREVSLRDNCAYYRIPCKLTRARKQVVAGMKYHLDLTIVSSNCTKNVCNSNFS